MRETKFKAWDKAKKKMLNVFSLSKYHITGHCVDDTEGEVMLQLPIGSVDLLPYTGLEDKNKIEIYRGDIIKTAHGNHYWISIVKELGGQFGHMLFSVGLYSNLSTTEDGERFTFEITYNNKDIRNYVKHGKYSEIIGNIYENPELLKP